MVDLPESTAGDATAAAAAPAAAPGAELMSGRISELWHVVRAWCVQRIETCRHFTEVFPILC